MTVQTHFENNKIPMSFVVDMQRISPEWDSKVAFIKENWEKNIETLSTEQLKRENEILKYLLTQRSV